MSAAAAIGTSGASGQAQRTAQSAFGALSSEQFIKIMFTELTNQDPLKPNDANQLLQQMSSLRDIETSMQMQSKLDALVGQNEFASASMLIGAKVSGVSVDNRRVSGVVSSVSRTSDGPVMTLSNGARVLFGNIDQVAPPDAQQPGHQTGGGTGNGNGNGNGTGSGGSTGGAGSGSGTGSTGGGGSTTEPPTTDPAAEADPAPAGSKDRRLGPTPITLD